METILVVDDEKNYLVVLEALLEPEGYEVLTADNGREAFRLFRDGDVDLVISDMKMPGMSGMELLEECKRIKPEVPIIMMTAFGTIEMAVEAMKKQAYDYITKPFQNEQLKLTIRKALENYRLVRENRLLTAALSERYAYANMVGKSRPMLKIYDLIEKVAPSKASVLITGPSGTGKELIAKAIHYNSPRKDRPFISVNCGALTETLLESELFGHERGAFTGAVTTKKGRFELADGGTLFLDEVGEMTPALQIKLLRVLQEMEFERVGGTRTLRVDVRVISASNRNMKEEVENSQFREDLFYRLNVIHIEVPPLFTRSDDIPLLVRHFMDKYREQGAQKAVELTPEAWRGIYRYSWPGNVRELENAIERAMVLKTGERITLDDLPRELRASDTDVDIAHLIPMNRPLPEILDVIEEKMLRRALAQCNNVQAHAAQLLGITKSLMQHKLKKYNIRV